MKPFRVFRPCTVAPHPGKVHNTGRKSVFPDHKAFQAMTVRIGTSGWVYPHWRGLFYPPELRQKDWFAHYARHFDTVEINNSFYRLPGPAVFEKWRAQAPAGFVYSVKASRFLTHVKRLARPEQPLRAFFEGAVRLKETLGPILYQLPPNWAPDLPRLRHFLEALPEGYSHVVEFRDPRWLTGEVFDLMERSGVSHCIHDRYGLDVPLRVTASPVYVRFHGDTAPGGDYTPEALEAWADRIRGWLNQSLDVYLYFNNDAGGYAVKNATSLKRKLGME
jgi:uncharacterized protein YecE (DUF72 family)